MPYLAEDKFDSSDWETGRVHISGTPSAADEVSIFYILARPPPSSKPSKGTLLLIHGFPQTSHQFRHLLAPLASAGYTVIAPDYRGAGYSSRLQPGDYTKQAVAQDLRVLLREKLGVEGKVGVVGLDIGGMVAVECALAWGEGEVGAVMWGECPLPGTEFYESTKDTEPGFWHFTFHNQADLPELLVQGKERIYLKHFYDRLSFRPDAIPPSALDFYTTQFAQPGAMRCGMDLYRAFSLDAQRTRKLLAEGGKCKVPCATLNGKESFLAGGKGGEMAREVFERVEQVVEVEGSGHWIGEEQPGRCVEAIVGFMGEHLGK